MAVEDLNPGSFNWDPRVLRTEPRCTGLTLVNNVLPEGLDQGRVVVTRTVDDGQLTFGQAKPVSKITVQLKTDQYLCGHSVVIQWSLFGCYMVSQWSVYRSLGDHTLVT